MKLKFLILGGSNAGKTSLLRRYFNNSFEPQRRTPTLGSDFYSKKIDMEHEDIFQQPQQQDGDEIHQRHDADGNDSLINNDSVYEIEGTISDEGMNDRESNGVQGSDGDTNNSAYRQQSFDTAGRITITKTHPVSIVCWDTPGRENVVIERKGNKARYTAVFSDRFFQNVHAALLVYDVTSTTSFTHVLRWHAELLERVRRMQASGERDKPLPIIIVGNKIDLMESQAEGVRPRASVRQRDVLGLLSRNYRGKDYHYEYSANPASSHRLMSPSSTNNHHSITSSVRSANLSSDRIPKNRSRFELSTYMGTSSNVDYLEAVLSNEVYRGSYLDSLLKNENIMGPDRDLVLLWAARNSVKHLEVSAKTGEGIDELMLELVRMAMVQLETENGATNEPLTLDHSKGAGGAWSVKNGRNHELDLQHRYLPKPRKPCFGCFELLSFQNCWNLRESELP